ncbi:Protein PRRC2C [Clarias magur]|uniref:Protein PRRC2C n=1 Tax=Clarias magur TaxID=1594786 RepID=A0A8J4T231_CLAMG|nr:Protein PRRC2C [Clarias magur]
MDPQTSEERSRRLTHKSTHFVSVADNSIQTDESITCVSDGEVEAFKVLIEMSIPIYCWTDGSVSVASPTSDPDPDRGTKTRQK